MKTMPRCLAILLSASFLLVSAPLWADEEAASPDPVALVNGEAITREALEFETQRMLQQLASQGQVPSEEMMPQLRQDVLNRMIEEELLYQDSQTKEITVPEARVEKEIASIRERFPNEEEYKAALAGIDLSEEDLARKISRGVAIETLIKEHVVQEVSVSEEESRAFYDQNESMFEKPEQVQARHILIKTESDADEAQKAEARRKIEDVRKKAVAGEDFATLAKDYSEGPSNARGGDLGYFSRGQMVKPFEDVAFALEKDAISEVVETQFGYHIIQVTDHQPASVVAYDTARRQIAERLKQEKSRRQIRDYIETLREKAEIEIKS
jgi:peptidyl-prolyl cis-trans isomerase C